MNASRLTICVNRIEASEPIEVMTEEERDGASYGGRNKISRRGQHVEKCAKRVEMAHKGRVRPYGALEDRHEYRDITAENLSRCARLY